MDSTQDSNDSSSVFEKLKALPSSIGTGWLSCTNIAAVDANKFIALSNHGGTMFEYSAVADEWNEISIKASGFNQRFAIDQKRNNVLLHDHQFVYSIGLENGHTMDYGPLDVDSSDALIVVEDNVHIFGEAQSRAHCIINIGSSSVTLLDVVPRNLVGGNNHAGKLNVFFLKKRNSIVLCYEWARHILEYPLDTKQYGIWEWSNLNERGGKKAAVITLDERYIVSFVHRDGEIVIYDLKRQSVSKSERRWPLDSSWCHAVLLGSNKNDEVTVFGFVREQYQSSEFDNMRALPKHVIVLMSKWFCNEWVHLIAEGGRHWRVNMDHIIRSTTL